MIGRDVSVISECDETIRGVLDYLRQAGTNAYVVGVADAGTSTSRDGVVFFADDYPKDVALGAVVRLRRSCAVLVVVTDDVEAFAASADDDVNCGRLFVLQRPAWSWMLVDALRAGCQEVAK